MNNLSSRFKDMCKLIAPSSLQVVTQYLGVSIDPSWPNSEVVVAEGRRSTTFVFSSGDGVLDSKICTRILNVNPDARVVLITDVNHPIPEDAVVVSDFRRFTSFVELSSIQDTVQLGLILCNSEDFSDTSVASALLLIFTSFGFKQVESLSQSDLSFVTTAIQAANQVGDIEVHELGGGWLLRVVKTIYPVLRDLSPFRGMVVTGHLKGHSFTLYKGSLDGAYKRDVERIKNLVEIGKTRRVMVGLA